MAAKRKRKIAKRSRRPSKGHDLDQKEKAMNSRSEANQEETHRLIASFDKGEGEEIRVHLCEWRDRVYVDIRPWRKPKLGEATHPMTGGFRLAAEFLPDLRSAIDAAIDHLEGGVEIVQDQEKGHI